MEADFFLPGKDGSARLNTGERLRSLGSEFSDSKCGLCDGLRANDAKTEDSGETWRVLVGPEEQGDQRVYNAFFLGAKLEQGYPKVKFVDRQVGWSVLGGTWAYTVDGGQHWTSRPIHFPAPVAAFSLPARDRGYVVGEHGMIYRYRIVPTDYTSKGMIEAPMMPENTPSSPN